jgi:hypothetical protein
MPVLNSKTPNISANETAETRLVKVANAQFEQSSKNETRAMVLYLDDAKETKCARAVMQKIIHNKKLDFSDEFGMLMLREAGIVYAWEWRPYTWLHFTPRGYAVLAKFVELLKEAEKKRDAELDGKPHAVKIKDHLRRTPMPVPL